MYVRVRACLRACVCDIAAVTAWNYEGDARVYTLINRACAAVVVEWARCGGLSHNRSLSHARVRTRTRTGALSRRESVYKIPLINFVNTERCPRCDQCFR